MLDARTDGKGLLLHRHTLLQQTFKGIACAVADRQDHMVCIQLLAHSIMLYDDARRPALHRYDLDQLCFKPDFSAQLHDLTADLLHDPRQQIGADMRFGLI